jgi:hypothetical protein
VVLLFFIIVKDQGMLLREDEDVVWLLRGVMPAGFTLCPEMMMIITFTDFDHSGESFVEVPSVGGSI